MIRLLFFSFLFFLPQAFAGLEARAPLKNPIVLVHGATMGGAKLQVGPLDFGDYFLGVPEFIGVTKTPVRLVELTTDASIGERAAVLKNFLETEFAGKKVNLICHSLGGLDARYAASVLKAKEIASITTIGTPHHGSPLTDWALRQMKEDGIWYRIFKLFGFDLKGRRFLPELSPDYLEKIFNPKVPDVPGIRYFSVAAAASFEEGSMSWMLWLPAHWLEAERHPLAKGAHDGLVPLASQHWGELLGEVRLDHLGQINHHEWRKDMTKESELLYSMIYDRLLGAGL